MDNCPAKNAFDVEKKEQKCFMIEAETLEKIQKLCFWFSFSYYFRQRCMRVNGQNAFYAFAEHLRGTANREHRPIRGIKHLCWNMAINGSFFIRNLYFYTEVG